MAMTLKTTGIAANAVMVVIVDPTDGDKVKWYSSSNTAGEQMTFSGSIGASTSWRSSTGVKSFTTTSSVVPAFTTKPTISLATNGKLSIYAALDFISFESNRGIIFGVNNDDSRWVARVADPPRLVLDGGGGAIISSLTAMPTGPASYGLMIDNQTFTNSKAWQADTSTADLVDTTSQASNQTFSWTLDYIGKANGANSGYLAADYFCVAAFNTNLSQAQFDSLHDDWKGVLFDAGTASVVPQIASFHRMLRDA